jgi:hypothetical protein
MHTYKLSIIARIYETVSTGSAVLTLVKNLDCSYTYSLKNTLGGVSSTHCPNIFEITGIGFKNNQTFNSSYKGYVLDFDITNGILNVSDVQQTLQIQGVIPALNPVNPANPADSNTGSTTNTAGNSNMLDTTYNTYNNFNGSGSGSCSKCGGQGGCGVTNIINLNNRND